MFYRFLSEFLFRVRERFRVEDEVGGGGFRVRVRARASVKEFVRAGFYAFEPESTRIKASLKQSMDKTRRVDFADHRYDA